MSLFPLRFPPRWIHAWRRLTAGREFSVLALLFAGVLTALVVLGLFAMRTLDVTRILVQGERYYATAQHGHFFI